MMMRIGLSGSVWILTALAVLTGCGGRAVSLPINPQQTLVCDDAVIAAGLQATAPTLSTPRERVRATARVRNQSDRAVTLHYRFYWYDEQGLERLPYDSDHQITVPARQDVTLISERVDPTINRVRLHIFL
ncbi:YcfL family protein [Musicola paradisiaca]|nr:YcfL family protein [Musicola paradisiaca]